MPMPAAPVITAVGPNINDSGMRIDYTYDGVNTTRVSVEVDIYNDAMTPFFSPSQIRFVRDYADPDTYINNESVRGFAVDYEATRNVQVFYRMRSWNFSGGIWTPSNYSNTMSGLIEVKKLAWFKDPFATQDVSGATDLANDGVFHAVIEGEQLPVDADVPSEVHTPLGRPDPVIVTDGVAAWNPTFPPGVTDHFPIIEVPFFIHNEDQYHDYRRFMSAPVRPVLVQTGYGNTSTLLGGHYHPGAHQFYGQLLHSSLVILTTARHQQVIVMSAATPAVNYYRLLCRFQTVRRPPDLLVP